MSGDPNRDPLSEIVVPPYEGPKPSKLFVGIRVSVQAANALAMATETIARRAAEAKIPLSFVGPTTYHVTLRYLGWARREVLPALRDKLAEAVAGVTPFSFRASRVRVLPGLIYAGIEGADALIDLAKRIEPAVVDLGFAARAREFLPHITLARARESRPLDQVVLPVSEQMFSDTRVDAISIIESEAKSGGSIYSDVAKISFERAENRSGIAIRRQGEGVVVSASHPDVDTDDGWPRGSTDHTD